MLPARAGPMPEGSSSSGHSCRIRVFEAHDDPCKGQHRCPRRLVFKQPEPFSV